jgi:hypothetical protein
MKRIAYINVVLLMAFALLVNLTSCVEKEFGAIPPSADTTSLVANTTIAELKSIYGGGIEQLSSTSFAGRDSILIEGIVVSDDKVGNFYKTIVIQDATGGIEVKLDKTTLYNEFPRGKRVVVYCNGLYLGNYGGVVQLGSTSTQNGITQLSGLEGDIIIRRHVFRKGRTLVNVNPLVIKASGLNASNFSRLVTFDSVQFKVLNLPTSTTRFTYADAVGKNSISHELMGCADSYALLFVRSSGYSRFAADTIPSRMGSVTGVLGYYNGDYQLVIRDLADVDFDLPRCN